jgi:hypothetical protein
MPPLRRPTLAAHDANASAAIGRFARLPSPFRPIKAIIAGSYAAALLPALPYYSRDVTVATAVAHFPSDLPGDASAVVDGIGAGHVRLGLERDNFSLATTVFIQKKKMKF